jgi:hypothetical protein
VAPPATVSAGFEILRALGAADEARLAPLATKRGRKCAAALLRKPGEELAIAVRSWKHTVGVRYEGDRARCCFAQLPGERVAVLELVAQPTWLLDDVRVVPSREYHEFGEVDDRTGGGVLPPGMLPPAPPPAAGLPPGWPMPQVAPTEVDVACARCGAVFRTVVAPMGTAFCTECGTGNQVGF